MVNSPYFRKTANEAVSNANNYRNTAHMRLDLPQNSHRANVTRNQAAHLRSSEPPAPSAAKRYIKTAKAQAQELAFQAAIVRLETAGKEVRTRRLGRGVMGTLQASFGASGVSVDGSPSDALMDQLLENEPEALTVRHEAVVQQTILRRAAANAREAGESAEFGGFLSTGAKFLGSTVDIIRVIDASQPGQRFKRAGT